jgi:hypothetical protein
LLAQKTSLTESIVMLIPKRLTRMKESFLSTEREFGRLLKEQVKKQVSKRGSGLTF